MSFGQVIREIWQGASDTSKQLVNEISHGGKVISPDHKLSLSPAQQKSTVALGFQQIQISFSDCSIEKPIINEPHAFGSETNNLTQ
jgi:hypothetical protein